MNAKKIVENMFLRSSNGLPLLGSMSEYLYLGKVFICLDLEPFFLVFNEGSWGLDACHCLVGGLNSALSKSAFQEHGHVV